MKNSRLAITILIASFQTVFNIHVSSQIYCAENLLHYWKLEENGLGVLYDSAGNLNASVTGIPARVEGIVGYAQFFDGSSEASLYDNNAFDWCSNSSFSIEFWMNKSSSCENQDYTCNNVIIGRDDAGTKLHWWTGISCTNPGKINFTLVANDGSGQDIISNRGVIDGNWHHVVVVRDGISATTSIFIDGLLDNMVSHTYTGDFSSTVPINIGWLDLATKYHYSGSLDELAIYNKAISTSEIADHYNSGDGISYCSQSNSIKTPVRIMPLGNSITQGYTDGTIPEIRMKGYRYDLKQFLKISGIEVDFVGSQCNGSDFYTDSQHAGIGGSRDQYVARLLEDGYDVRNDVQILVPPRPYLDEYKPDIILLHIGTNDITSEADPISVQMVSYILDLIDQYEIRSNKDVIVFLALIINRKKPWTADSKAEKTTDFNNFINTMAQDRIAAGDKLVIVDMENDAGFLYDNTDMADILHPNSVGYTKMALAWYNKLADILPNNLFKPCIVLSPVDYGVVDNRYTSKICAFGNPAPFFSLMTAPDDMTIDPESGMISWTPKKIGDYDITALVSNNLGSDTLAYVLKIVDYIPDSIMIFPNPASNEIIIKLLYQDVNNSFISIYNAYGILIDSKEIEESSFIYNISSLKIGSYVIHIRTDKKIVTGKFIKY